MNALKTIREDFYKGLKDFFEELNIPVNYLAEEPAKPIDILSPETFNENNEGHKLMVDVYFLGIVNDDIFEEKEIFQSGDQFKKAIKEDYDGIVLLGITLKNRENGSLPTRTHLADITRAFNREFKYTPVTIVFKYGDYISFANSERLKYKQEWREGEKAGKVTLLRDIDLSKTHSAHLKILSELKIDPKKITSYEQLYKYWQSVFVLQTLNDQFYADLQEWFYYALANIKLPFCPTYIDEKENTKNFLVRLLARTLFCWFVKEKGLIDSDLLELTDWDGKRYKLTSDAEDKSFLNSNSYYRGILQNIFFNALNLSDKSSLKDFKWTKYLHPDFKLEWFTRIPYLNGGIFDKLEEDNAKESIEDGAIKIPNFLFYGIEKTEKITIGKGAKARTENQKVEHKGLNGILKSYKFTLDENTPFEEDIALDPEMLGLVFENLLAELDPNLEESTKKSIRKLTGSYYTPRKVILEMVNDSLFIYLAKYLEENFPGVNQPKKVVADLVYYLKVDNADKVFCKGIVEALDKYKVLDPACGSGAFPMGMLHRMVEILKLVDSRNEYWLELKLKHVDQAQKTEFKKVLTKHLDDYGRKLGIIRDSIYGIDIQPMAVQLTKLRFFISLLIDQNTEKGITPMPNIETKIICADSLKNIQPDLFSTDAIEKLMEARNQYYQPDISTSERERIAGEIVSVLDQAFPFFAREITGKNIPGQNPVLLKEWFIHSTIAAPFFNMEFFYPELQNSGFDCVIGNPPYGGAKITDEVRNNLGIESKDPYGAFIARFLNDYNQATPLKYGGVLAYIVSDTFMTIKSHLKLRKKLMQNYVHKMIRVDPDTFGATVNTVIMVAERSIKKEFDDNHVCLMADMTNISIHDQYEYFMAVLAETRGADFTGRDIAKNISNEEYAIYYYPQELIRTNSNLPFFVASPKLFALMNDTTPLVRNNSKPKIQYKTILNGKSIDLYQLGDEYSGSGKTREWKNSGVLKIISGIKTGDNSKYIFKTEKGRGKYIEVDPQLILPEMEIENLSTDEKSNGITPQNHNGKYIVPLDKGGESDSGEGWMPNYYVPTDYFIDWRKSAVKSMAGEVSSDLANPEFRFKEGLTYSRTGVYAPTFRISSGGILESKGCGLFNDEVNLHMILGLLNSKVLKFIIKNYVMHSVESSVGTLPFTLICIPNKPLSDSIESLTSEIILKQKNNPRYDYASHEQIEIDKLVYEAYELNAEDVQEVENWYARRYPRLSAAQKANLIKAGKSDDYLELYGMKK